MKKLLTTAVAIAILASSSAVGSSAFAQEKQGKWATTPDPNLPNVLILGDSISIGYTLQVREALSGKANVFRPCTEDGKRPENCAGTTKGVEAIDRWLEGHKWDVIHFNFGLHDLKHVKPEGGAPSSDPNDPLQATVDAYSKNLQAIVAKLDKTGAKLIFATTTPVVPGTTGPLRSPDSPPQYNTAALEIMKKYNVEINDLFAFCEPRLEKIQRPKNVHFTPEGSNALAKQVVAAIEQALSNKTED